MLGLVLFATIIAVCSSQSATTTDGLVCTQFT